MVEHCQCYAKAIDPERQELWKCVFPPEGKVPISCPVPGKANLAGQEANFYPIDFTRVSPEAKARLIKEMAAKFNLQEEEVARDIELQGCPVKADSVIVAWCPMHSRAAM